MRPVLGPRGFYPIRRFGIGCHPPAAGHPRRLRADIYYARKFPTVAGALAEETDRYAQALLYRNLARLCWSDARQRL